MGCAMSEFLHFPLSALTLGESEEATRNLILGWSVIHAGLKAVEKIQDNHGDEIDKISEADAPKIDMADELQVGCVIGGDVVGRWHTNPLVAVNHYKAVQSVATPPWVQVATTVYDDCDGGKFAWRDFRVLCAVYSCLGSDDIKSGISRVRIRAAALGYSKWRSIFLPDKATISPEGERLLAARKDGERPLTVKQLRDTLDKLEFDHGFFRKIQLKHHAREVWWTRRLSYEQLVVEASKTDESRKSNRKASKFARDLAMNKTGCAPTGL